MTLSSTSAAQTSTAATSPPTSRLIRAGRPLLDRAVAADRQVWFRLVTRDVDRHGTIIEPAGVDLTFHRQNPVFLWMHDSGGGPITPPPDVVIGRVVDYDQTREHLDILVEFDDDGEDGLASTCYRKVRGGYIRMVSIGCNALEETTTRVDGADVPTYPRSELLECSLVIIGSNRAALKLDRAAAAAMVRSLKEPDDEDDVDEDDETEERNTPLSIPLQQPGTRRVASVAVFNPAGAMLWGRRRDSGKWTTPGGHLDDGEEPTVGAARELKEEANIDAAQPELCHGLVHVGDMTTERGIVVHCYRCDLKRDVVASSVNDPDVEVEQWRWVELRDGMLPDGIRSALHAPHNAMIELGVCRGVDGAGGFAAADAVLSTKVDDGLAAATSPRTTAPSAGPAVAGIVDAAKTAAAEMSDNAGDDDDDAISTIFDDEADAAGLVVKAAAVAPAPQHRTVVAHKSFPLVDKPWDADAAVARWRRWASSDGSGDKAKIDWAKYAECFLWFDSDDKENFGSYKMPHHDIVDGKPVTMWQGVVAATARINQTRGIPTDDLKKMKAHLAAHYREFDKPVPEVLSERGTAAALLRTALEDVDFTASASTKSELKLGLRWYEDGFAGDGLEPKTVADAHRIVETSRWWPEKVVKAAAWFARHDEQPGPMRDDKGRPTPKAVARALWGGDAGKKEVKRIRAAMRDVVDRAAYLQADPSMDAQAATALMRKCAYSHQAAHYLFADSQYRAAVNPQKRPSTEIATMKTPMSRAMYRGLIQHSLEGADMHAQMMEGGHVADEHRAMHHAMAMRMLDHAADMASTMRAMPMLENAAHAEPDGDEFPMRATMPEGELKSRFAEVAKTCGKLPRTLRSVVKAELGVDAATADDLDLVEEKLMGLKTDRDAFVSLKRSAEVAQDRADKAETEKLINDALDKRLIAPADAKKMRGLNPANDAVVAQPWSRVRVERFVAERAEVGPIADVVRPGEVRTVSPAQDAKNTSTVPGAAGKNIAIRMGRSAAPATEASLQALAQGLAGRIPGVDVAAILGKVDEARNLPSAGGQEALRLSGATK